MINSKGCDRYIRRYVKFSATFQQLNSTISGFSAAEVMQNHRNVLTYGHYGKGKAIPVTDREGP
jgi:hypothetical protein